MLRRAFIAVLASVLALAITWRPSQLWADDSVTARHAPPELTLENAAGKLLRLSDFKGHVVLLDFWATWCTGCKEEIPWFVEFHKKYQGAGLRAIGVAMDEEGWRKVKPYLREHPIPYSIVLGSSRLQNPYQITALPVTLLIDRQGMVADTHVGVVDKHAWEREIQKLLQEPGRSAER